MFEKEFETMKKENKDLKEKLSELETKQIKQLQNFTSEIESMVGKYIGSTNKRLDEIEMMYFNQTMKNGEKKRQLESIFESSLLNPKVMSAALLIYKMVTKVFKKSISFFAS